MRSARAGARRLLPQASRSPGRFLVAQSATAQTLRGNQRTIAEVKQAMLVSMLKLEAEVWRSAWKISIG